MYRDGLLAALEVGLVLLAIAAIAGRLARPRRRGAHAHRNADGSAKRRYGTETDARAAARDYERDFGDRMNAYRCSRGRHWHIGHVR